MVYGTLNGKLREINEHAGFSRDNDLEVVGGDKKYSEMRAKEIEDFFKSDHLADRVSRGETSYHSEVVRIGSNYNSFWKRAFRPTLDKANDELTVKVIESMNWVSGKNFHSKEYTSNHRREIVSNSNQASFGAGFAGALTVGTLAYFTDSFGVENEVIGGVIQYALPALSFASAKIIGKLKLNSDMKEKVRDLSDWASNRDRFLRECREEISS